MDNKQWMSPRINLSSTQHKRARATDKKQKKNGAMAAGWAVLYGVEVGAGPSIEDSVGGAVGVVELVRALPVEGGVAVPEEGEGVGTVFGVFEKVVGKGVAALEVGMLRRGLLPV
ncbi:hypothetical protein Nepgr_006377 [Nepenthes gracilis]|uniref:Uncharacterized protein n=1 Tax=Nepenthes gracilis TaxID=150966 RepID=A0AAD3S4X3_NEPGR|nr:hypothetical protein Nepgr_006377 [Nepenthes gracilis]